MVIPISYVLSVFGTKLDTNSPPISISSLVESPIPIVPPLKVAFPINSDVPLILRLFATVNPAPTNKLPPVVVMPPDDANVVIPATFNPFKISTAALISKSDAKVETPATVSPSPLLTFSQLQDHH